MNLGGRFHGWLISWQELIFIAAFLELYHKLAVSLRSAVSCIQWTSSRMLGRSITQFGLSVLRLAGARSDKAGAL